MTTCDYCGEEVDIPFNCKFCGGTFCSKHRLPEAHECAGLDEYKENAKKEEGVIYEPFRSDSSNKKSGKIVKLNRLLSKFSYAEKLVSVIVLAFLVELFIGPNYTVNNFGFVVNKIFSEPWRIITSMFIHAGFMHLFGNCVTLYFLGNSLENLVGSKDFLQIFFIGGVSGAIFSFLMASIGLGNPDRKSVV